MIERRQGKLLLVICVLAWAVCVQLPANIWHSASAAQDLPGQAIAILQNSCWQCHGEDKMAGLDLRTRESALRGGGRGEAIKPGQADESLLYQYIAGKASPRMPLGGELSDEQIALIKKWIDEGAAWPQQQALSIPPVSRDLGRSKITDADRQ